MKNTATNHSFKTTANAQLIITAVQQKLSKSVIGNANDNMDSSNMVLQLFSKGNALKRSQIWIDSEQVVFFIGRNVFKCTSATAQKKLTTLRTATYKYDEVELKVAVTEMKKVAEIIALLETVDVKKLETLNTADKKKKAQQKKKETKEIKETANKKA